MKPKKPTITLVRENKQRGALFLLYRAFFIACGYTPTRCTLIVVTPAQRAYSALETYRSTRPPLARASACLFLRGTVFLFCFLLFVWWNSHDTWGRTGVSHHSRRWAGLSSGPQAQAGVIRGPGLSRRAPWVPKQSSTYVYTEPRC